jgi:hypothetical protein
MINFNFNIRIPGSNRFRNIRVWHGITPVAHKFWELQIYLSADIIDIKFGVTAKQDHSGIQLCLGLCGINVDFSIYDSRHWSDGKWHSQT